MRVSVIATVYNEAACIEHLLDSLARQTVAPDEIVIVDGGSTDDTAARIERGAKELGLPLVLLTRPGCNISQGRNLAIEAAQGEIIAATDAGVRLAEGWLETLLAPFQNPDPPDVVGGFFVPEPTTPFELALAAVTLPRVQDIAPESFNPSSRSVAFRRTAWQAVGGYPEWLDYCEDLLFDFALRDAGFRFAFAPRALVYYRPRTHWLAFYRQYYRYARGDGKADFWRYRHAVRYGTYLVALPFLLVLAIAVHPLWWLGVLLGLAGLLRTPLRRLRPLLAGVPWRERVQALAWLPVLRLMGDVAKMLGYPVGVLWRLRHAPRQPWAKRQL
ncbi:MAG: glycosyltransferase [Anaerolineae bacterium]